MKNNTLIYIAISLVVLYFLYTKLTFVGTTGKSKFGESSSSSSSMPSSETKVVIFYAPWCGHCKKSMKEFLKAAQNSMVALVNSDEDPGLVQKYQVDGFPTIVRISDNVVYKGARIADDIVDFATRD
jgi:thiol-disulfide isomerase/thioredoxin